RFNGTNLSGATKTSYTRTNAQSADAGNYSVQVFNGLGSVFSSNAVLTVNAAPSITAQPQGQAVVLGSSAGFNVTAVGAAPLAYQWRKDGTNLANGANISGATTSALAVSNVQLADLGAYTVAVSNSYGSVTSSPSILGQATVPVILTQPQNQTNNFGTLASFNVVATGNGLTYQWRRAGTNLADGGKISEIGRAHV